MAAASGSGDDTAFFDIFESDSESEFEGFCDAELEQAEQRISQQGQSGSAGRRQSDDEFDMDELGLDTDTSDSSTDDYVSSTDDYVSSTDDYVSSNTDSSDNAAQPVRRSLLGRGRGRGRAAQPRAQTAAASQWTTNLVNQTGLPYLRAADVGVTNTQQNSELTAFGLFTLFFTDYLLRDIVTETNRYAGQCMSQPPKRGKKHLPWTELTVPECRTWLGLLLSMGIVQKVGRLAEYWSMHAATLTPSFGLTMSRQRFLQILRYLHFVNNEDPQTDKTVKTWKVKKVMDYVVKRFREMYTPRRELSVDETILKFKGRLSIKQYIKIKPVKWGIKLFTLAESTTGYVLNLVPYVGKRDDTNKSKTTQTVLDVSCHYLNLGHHIFFDNYYTSIELMKALFAEKTLCCGTINMNRVGLPLDVKKKCPAVKKLKRGESLKRMQGNILAVTWMDTRVVNLLCNIPDCLGDNPVHRREKKTGAQITVSRPQAIELYNRYMGGVDLSDQRISTYRRHMKSLTWYLQIFFHLVELSAVQAYLLHRELHPGTTVTQHAFLLSLIDGLIGGRTYVSRIGRPVAEPRPQDVRFNRELEHAPVKLATSSKCAVHIRRVDTMYACSACNVRMCPTPCFHRYHYMEKFAYDDPTKKAALARKRKH